jgi:opacity protein-like surface antigen
MGIFKFHIFLLFKLLSCSIFILKFYLNISLKKFLRNFMVLFIAENKTSKICLYKWKQFYFQIKKGVSMKKIILSIVAIASLTSTLSATEIVGKVSSVKLDYKESGTAGQKLDEEARFGKINGFEIESRSNDYLSTNTRLYQDGTISYNSGDTDTARDKLIEASYKLGAAINIIDNASIGAHVGIGMRAWDRKLDNGNEEVHSWSNWIVGTKADWKATKELIVSATADYQKAVNPKTYSSVAGEKFNLGDTSGYKLGLHANYKLSQNLSVETDYVYDYWKINKSNTVNSMYVPDSKTKNQYLKLGLAYKF